jgi:hypothetical protein
MSKVRGSNELDNVLLISPILFYVILPPPFSIAASA